MTLTIESTGNTALLKGVNGVPVRMWKGQTAQGRECCVYVALIQVAEGDMEEFKVELAERRVEVDILPAAVLSGSE